MSEDRDYAKVELNREVAPDGRTREFYERFVGVMVYSGLDRSEPSQLDDAIPMPFSAAAAEWLRNQPIKNGYFSDGTPIPDEPRG